MQEFKNLGIEIRRLRRLTQIKKRRLFRQAREDLVKAIQYSGLLIRYQLEKQ